MIFTLTILIDVCLIFAVWGLLKKNQEIEDYLDNMNIAYNESWIRIEEKFSYTLKKNLGRLDKIQVQSKIAEKMADRAFNMASSANLGVVALQKALATPRLMTKPQVTKNQLAKNEVDKLFTTEGNFDWLRPILSDEELEILDKAEDLKNGNQNKEAQ